MSLLTEASLVITPNAVEEGKLFSIIPTDGSGDMDAVRATTATLVNSEGVIEDCPYNLLSYSEQFNNASWVKLASTTSANNTIAPNGLLTADKLVEDTSASAHRFISTSFATTSGIVYSFSIFFKKGEREYAYIRFNNSGGDIIAANINLLNGTVSQSIFGNITIIPYNNDWYRVIATGTSTSTSSGSVEIRTSNSPTYANYTGDGTSGIYLWGAQLVKGTEPKEYFPTTNRLNVPRLDYTNGSCPSILVEPQRTNLLLRSEEFDNAIWTKTTGIVVTSNSEISPNGTLTADTINFGASNRFVSQATTLATGVVATGSIYVKGISGQTIQLAVGGVDVLFTLNGNWQRLESTRTSLNSVFNLNTFGGATARIISIWGAQLEAGSNATSYIPTVASTVTRNADVISKSGISSLINSQEGVLFCEISALSNDITDRLISLTNGTSTERISIYYSSNSSNLIKGIIFVNGAIQCDFSYTSDDIKTNTKIALKYKENDFSLYVNGVKRATDNSGITFPANKLNKLSFDLGLPTITLPFNGNVKKIAVFPTALSDVELSQLTTL